MKSVFLRLFLFLICLCSEVGAYSTSPGAKAIYKVSTKKAAANIGKSTIKVVSKGVVKEVPTGKEALKVICHADGSCTPAIHNLGKNSVNFSDEFNRVLLRERRKAVTDNYQYLSLEQLNKSRPEANLTEASSRRKLRENIYKRMEKEYSDVAKGFGGTEAHHVVEGNAAEAAKSREILKKFNIGINDAENGVLLPSDLDKSIYKGALHNTSHSEEYSRFIYSKIKDVKSREELVVKLIEIKKLLVSGKLDLQGHLQETTSTLIF